MADDTNDSTASGTNDTLAADNTASTDTAALPEEGWIVVPETGLTIYSKADALAQVDALKEQNKGVKVYAAHIELIGLVPVEAQDTVGAGS